MRPIQYGTWLALAKGILCLAALLLIPGSLIALPVLWWRNHHNAPCARIASCRNGIGETFHSRGVDPSIVTLENRNRDKEAAGSGARLWLARCRAELRAAKKHRPMRS